MLDANETTRTERWPWRLTENPFVCMYVIVQMTSYEGLYQVRWNAADTKRSFPAHLHHGPIDGDARQWIPQDAIADGLWTNLLDIAPTAEAFERSIGLWRV